MITAISTRHDFSKLSANTTVAKKSHSLALIFLLFICCSLEAFAQSQFDVWTTDQGLPQNSVQAILQTRDGYLWLATFDGLVRFDGVQFTVFNSGNSPGLKSNRFTCLFEDRDGILWVGTEDAGLARYKDGSFTSYTVADGLPANRVRQIQNDPDPQGQILVVTTRGIIRWPNSELLKRAAADNGIPIGFRYVDLAGASWFSDDQQLYQTKGGVETVYTLQDGLLSAGVTAMYQDREGSIWIANINLRKQRLQSGYYDASIQRLKDGVFRNYPIANALVRSYVTFFYEDREGQLWFGTSHDGLFRLSYSNDDQRYDAASPSERIHLYTTADGLSSNAVTSLYEDVEGTFWIGTTDQGLNRLRRQIIMNYTEKNGLGGDNVYPIYQDRAGNIWLGTWRKGLTIYKAGNFTHYTGQNDLPAGNLITALAEDREGRMWIGGYGGVCWFENGKFNTLPEKLMLDGGGLNAIHQDREGDLWFGADVAGLYRYHQGQLSHLTTNDGLPSNSVHVILEDEQGALWVGTYGGLIRFKDDKLTVYTTKDGLASNRIRSLYLDGDGTLWIGTYDGGLSRFKGGRFTSYTPRDGLFNSGVFQILEDDHENFWFSCNLGIYRVTKRELNDFAEGKIQAITSVAYGKADGMLNQECNGGTQPAGIRARDGKLWFPTQAGVAIVDPDAVNFNSHPPPVMIESALVDRQARDVNRSVRIEPGQTNLEIHYTGLSFIKPEQVKFKYRLEGVDQDWVEAGTRRVAYYSHLAPGTYTFTVIAANSDGLWNTHGASLSVRSIPPFYRTWWFLLLSGSFVGGMIFLFYRRRVARLERARAAQEAFSQQLIESQERERKRIAAELHDSLGQNLLIIKNRALLGLTPQAPQTVSLEQLNEISETATQAIEEVREIARNLHPYKLDRLGLTKALESIIEQAAAASEINFTSQIDPVNGLFSKEAEINLYRIVQESINNILKHSRATQVQLLVTRDQDSLSVEIRDNGVGFETGAILGEEGGRRGFGLAGITERARILGGKHTLYSSPGQGTTITLKIELRDNQHETRTEHSHR